MKKIFLVVFILTSISVISSCYYDNFEELYPGAGLTCDTSINVTFAATIKPIMESRCGSNDGACHNASGSGFYNLSTIDGINVAIADNKFIESIKHLPGASRMPKNSTTTIDPCDIALIDKWLSTGKNP